MKFCVVLVTLGLLLGVVAAAGEADKISSFWKFDLSNFKFDPNQWSQEFRTRMLMVGGLAAYTYTMTSNLTKVAAVGAFAFGLVKLSWPLIGALGATAYGYFRNQKMFLLGGAVASYYLAFGGNF